MSGSGASIPDRKIYVPAGIVVPWFSGLDATLFNVRRANGKPKYQAVRGPRRDGIDPRREGIIPGKPLVILGVSSTRSCPARNFAD